jgi:UDP-N-acetylglucosamine 2-epimerase (non-hydrolysing)
MPEEINRVLTDQISDYLFTTEASARDNLVREGVTEDRIFFVGNVMIDTLLRQRQQAAERPVLSGLGIEPRGYVLVTLHRPSNVDDPVVLTGLTEVLGSLSERLPVVFPVHPRTRRRLSDFGLDGDLNKCPGLKLIEPLGYLDFLQCMDNARLVITDSGGIQEETTVLGVPCVTTRDNTERPVTVDQGTNVVVGRDPRRLLDAAFEILRSKRETPPCPELWDGRAAERIVEILWDREGARAAPNG